MKIKTYLNKKRDNCKIRSAHPKHINPFSLSLWELYREVAQPGRALELANMLSWWRSCRGLPMVGFILACLGHRNRAVAGSNPALPTSQFIFYAIPLAFSNQHLCFTKIPTLNSTLSVMIYVWTVTLVSRTHEHR